MSIVHTIISFLIYDCVPATTGSEWHCARVVRMLSSARESFCHAGDHCHPLLYVIVVCDGWSASRTRGGLVLEGQVRSGFFPKFGKTVTVTGHHRALICPHPR